jgi:hypothetical protein
VTCSLLRGPVVALCAAALLTFSFGFAADGEKGQAAIAIVDFSYVDTSGEVRDQRSEHEARLANFMSALKRDLTAGGRVRIVVPLCGSEPCAAGRSGESDVLNAARAAGADLLLTGGIHKMSTLVQWAAIKVIDVKTGQVVLDKLFTFRGDTDESWRRAEAFMANELAALDSSR